MRTLSPHLLYVLIFFSENIRARSHCNLQVALSLWMYWAAKCSTWVISLQTGLPSHQGSCQSQRNLVISHELLSIWWSTSTLMSSELEVHMLTRGHQNCCGSWESCKTAVEWKNWRFCWDLAPFKLCSANKETVVTTSRRSTLPRSSSSYKKIARKTTVAYICVKCLSTHSLLVINVCF